MADDRINRKLPLEGQMFEYKSTVPPPKVLAREIAAFANARGMVVPKVKTVFGQK